MGWRAGIRPIIEDEVVVSTVSWIVNADKVKPDGDRPPGGSNDGPLAVSVVRVCAGIARTAEHAAVSEQSPPAARC